MSTDSDYEAMANALRFDAPALSRFGVQLSRWDARKVRWWLRLRQKRRAQAIILHDLDVNGSGWPRLRLWRWHK